MREFGISYEEGSALPVGSYTLHRQDDLSLPTVFGAFVKGICGPIKAQPAARLCMAMGHELARVERIDEETGAATTVWSAKGDHPRSLEEEIASLPGEPSDMQGHIRAILAGTERHPREEIADAAAYFREQAFPAIAAALEQAAISAPTRAEMEPAAPIAGVPDDPTAPRLDPNDHGPNIEMSIDDALAAATLDEPLAAADPAPTRPKKKRG